MRENRAQRKMNGRSASSNQSMGKVLSILLAVLAAVFFLLDDFIFYDLLHRPELSYLSLPVVILLLVLSSVKERKK